MHYRDIRSEIEKLWHTQDKERMLVIASLTSGHLMSTDNHGVIMSAQVSAMVPYAHLGGVLCLHHMFDIKQTRTNTMSTNPRRTLDMDFSVGPLSHTQHALYNI